MGGREGSIQWGGGMVLSSGGEGWGKLHPQFRASQSLKFKLNCSL